MSSKRSREVDNVDATVESTNERDAANETGDENESGGAPEDLPLVVVFDLLKNQRRRYVLRYLRENDGEANLRELSEQVAAWENDKPIRAISSDERKRVYVGLYQSHLPKMDDCGVIEFDKPRGDITLTAAADQLYEYINDDSEHEWTPYYLVIATLGLMALGGAALAVPPFGWAPLWTWFGVVLLAFCLLTLVSMHHDPPMSAAK